MNIQNPFERITKAEGDEKLSHWCKTYAERPFNGNVYHYTNLAALGGIVSSRSMFCTDYRQLNDSTELSLGFEVVEAAIAARGANAGMSAHDIEQAFDHIARLRRAPFHMSMFATSFSMRRNDLTQWRAYAPQNGVSIGFRETALKRLAQDQHFVCGAVRYLGAPLFNRWLATQLTEMSDGLKETANNEVKLRRKAAGDPQEQIELMIQIQRSGNLERWIGEVAAFLKNADFRSEQEWRAVFVLRENTIQPRKSVHFRESGSRVIRFVEFDFSSIDANELISEVVIGPGRSEEEVFWLVGDILKSAGIIASIERPFHAIR